MTKATRIKSAVWCAALACSFFSARAQAVEIQNLVDSARFTWYVDFSKIDQFVNRAERLASDHGLRGNEVNLIELYNFRILACQNFSRLQLWKECTSELAEFLSNNKAALSPEQYRWHYLRNKVAIAQYYDGINDYAKGLELLLSLDRELKKLPESSEVCEQLYAVENDIAAIYAQRGEYEASVNQLLASIPYWECSVGTSAYATVYRNIGATYLNKGDYLQARRYLTLAEHSVQQLLREDPLTWARVALSLYETQASLYEQTGRHDSAALAIKKAVPLLSFTNVDNAYKARINFSLAKLYLNEGKWSTSHAYFDKAEHLFLNSTEDRPNNLSSMYLSRAELSEKENKNEEALAYCQKAMEVVTPNSKQDNDGNPSLQEVVSKKRLFRAIQKKSLLLESRSREKKDDQVLIRAFRTNQLSLALLDSTANEFSLDNDKVILAKESFGTFEAGIRMAYSLYQQTHEAGYLDDCFQLMDKSKGLILLENLRVVNHFAGVSPEWLEKERAMKSELFLTEQSLYQNETGSSASDNLHDVRERYAGLKSSYATLIAKIKAEAPDYYKLRFDHHVIGPAQIQQDLNPDEGLIEFFVGDSSLTVFGLSKTKSFIEQKKLTATFLEEVNRFRILLTQIQDETHPAEMQRLSLVLFDFLLKDCMSSLGSELSSLIIVPDGVLGYVPFEAFMTSEGGNARYLADAFSIRYAHSVSYLHEQTQNPAKYEKDFFAGFVASGDGEADPSESNAGVLVGAKKEVSSIAELLGSGSSIFDPATKEEFIREAPHYKVLHLAMHSVVNDKNPMLSAMIFSKSEHDSSMSNQLTAIELYSLQLKAELAVLSACETGFGVSHRGEGIMSFSRAFAYAGVNSALISLWKVPDKATARIMIGFYTHLKDGKSKAEALRLAKLDFIRNYPAMTHPYYWSGFILAGNNEPLEFPTTSVWIWVWLVGGLLVITAGLIMFFRLRASAPKIQSF